MTRLSGEWLTQPGAQSVMRMLTDAGHAAYFVGGCVRNDLLGAPVADVDIATDATPEIVIKLAEGAGLRPVPTGIEHGTVTVIADGIPHEVTTFRKDVETDGRRAVVAYSDSVEEDARRRDFTMNALYADAGGRVIDPLGGLPDLTARRVRFIDDAGARIREDYLRILRFFRFHAWYGDVSRGIDPDGLAACAANLGGLETLSKERIGAEMLKLLSAPDPAPSVAVMAQSGVLGAILPGADARALPVLVHLEQAEGARPNPIRRLAALGGEDVDAALRLSKAEARERALLRDAAQEGASAAELGYRIGRDSAVNALLLRAALLEQPLPDTATGDAARGAAATFPVSAADLMPDYTGPALGERLRDLEARWIDSGFTLGKADLLG